MTALLFNEVLHRNTVRFSQEAKRHGVNVTLYETEGLWHVWHLFSPLVPESKKAIRNIGEFIKVHTGKGV